MNKINSYSFNDGITWHGCALFNALCAAIKVQSLYELDSAALAPTAVLVPLLTANLTASEQTSPSPSLSLTVLAF